MPAVSPPVSSETFDGITNFSYDPLGRRIAKRTRHACTLFGWDAVPLDEVEDKSGYLRALYEKLAGHEPRLRDFGSDVELADAIGPHGIDVRQ